MGLYEFFECDRIKSDTAHWYPHTMVTAFMPPENFGFIEELEGAGIFKGRFMI